MALSAVCLCWDDVFSPALQVERCGQTVNVPSLGKWIGEAKGEWNNVPTPPLTLLVREGAPDIECEGGIPLGRTMKTGNYWEKVGCL